MKINNNKFIHLKNRSHYSILEGSIKIEDLIDKAITYNMDSVALTDNCNLFGAMNFSKYAIKKGIQPIIGCSMDLIFSSEDFNQCNISEITLYVSNKIGWRNLSKLLSRAYLNLKEYKRKIITFKDLKENNQGLLVLFSDIRSISTILNEVGNKDLSLVKKIRDIFTDRIYIDLFRENKNISIKETNLMRISFELDIPLICSNNVHFLEEEMYEAHDCLYCIHQSTNILNLNRKKINKESYFKNTESMVSLFSDIPEALINTSNFAKRCSFFLEESKPKLPSITSIAGKNEETILKERALTGLKNKLLNISGTIINMEKKYDNYFNRLKYELKVICSMGYAGYFLIVSDFITWSKNKSIPVGPGRGSGAGSIVAWALLITNLDPIKYGLLFERFLNPDRISLPDFDIDFCKYRREEVIEYVRNKYGLDKVAQIITFGSLQARAVIKDVGRVLGLNYTRVDRIAKLIPNTPGVQVSLKQLVDDNQDFKALINEDKELEKLFEISLKLEGLNRNVSTHAAGIVISNQAISEDVPLYYDYRSNIPATQFSMKNLEQIGLIKFDFLGLETLSVLDETTKLLKKRNISVDLERIELNDEKTYQTLTMGKTLGIFQLESIPMREVLRQLKPDRIEDIIAVVALYRPGPMENIPSYIARKHNNKLTTYPHPLLEDVLKETYGIMIYQEQVMEAAKIIAGFSLAKADLLRRAMGKKIKSEMKGLKESFIEGSKKNKIASNDAIKIFKDIEKFAGYGFNKSHAAAYALISYQTAWCKTNYPAEFLTSLLNSEIGNTSEKISYIKSELDVLGIKFFKSDINKSQALFSVENYNGEICVRSGLANIKNIGIELANEIVKERNKNGIYKSVIDFITRLEDFLNNKRQIEFLSMAGVFDQFETNRAIIFESASNLLLISQTINRDIKSEQKSLFYSKPNEKEFHHLFKKADMWPLNVKFLNEYNALSFFTSGTPLEEEQGFFNDFKLSNSLDIINNRINGKTFEVLGFLVKYEERLVNNSKFLDLHFIDNKGTFNVSIFKDKIEELNVIIKEGLSYVVVLNHSLDRDNRMRLRIKSLKETRMLTKKNYKKSKIYLNDAKSLEELKGILQSCEKGSTNVILVYNNRQIHTGFSVSYDEKTFSKIKYINSVETIKKFL